MSKLFLSRSPRRAAESCDSGVVTVYDRGYGVLSEGEQRGVQLCCPGGYLWKPALGEAVLVIKSGASGERARVIGNESGAAPVEPAAGEVCIYSPAASIHVKNDGSIQLRGIVNVTGALTVNGLPVTGMTE